MAAGEDGDVDVSWDGNNSEESDCTDDQGLKEMFERACEHLHTKASFLEPEQLLYFYSRYKQAVEGPCNIPKPSFFDFQGKQKWVAWKTLGDMTKETAMNDYIAAMKQIDPDWSPENGSSLKQKIMAKAFSTMPITDDYVNEEQKTAFDWIKENNISKVNEFIGNKGFFINQRDEQEMTLLHWACDRGFAPIVEILLEKGIDIDAQDEDGQTALHYASSCGHKEIVQLLLKHGAETRPDKEGMTAKRVALNKEIEDLFVS